jgi:hypothetical protein
MSSPERIVLLPAGTISDFTGPSGQHRAQSMPIAGAFGSSIEIGAGGAFVFLTNGK